MGYYLVIPVPSANQRRHFLDFFQRNWRPSRDLFPWLPSETGEINQPLPGRQVCAYGRATEIGFYYGAGWEPEQRELAYGVARWMALRVEHDDPAVIPHYRYESDVQQVFDAAKHPEVTDGWNEDWDLVDATGFTRSTRADPEEVESWSEDYYGKARIKRLFAADDVIRGELQRLSDLWVQERSTSA